MTENNKANIILDASKIDLFETCPTRYKYRYLLMRVLPPHRKAKALDFGSLIHNGYEVYYNRLREGIDFKLRLEETLTKISELSADPLQSAAEPEEVNHLINIITQNLDYWRAEDENQLEILAVETPFAYTLFEDEFVRIIISGMIDLLVNYHAVGRGSNYENLVIDHKSFSRDGSVNRLSNQFINYCSAVGSNYLIVNRIGLHKTKEPSEKFKRLPLAYDPVYIDAWKKNLIAMISQEYLSCLSTGIFPMKPTSCLKFNRLCEYYDVCDASGEDAKIFKLNNMYVSGEEWDVTKGLVNE